MTTQTPFFIADTPSAITCLLGVVSQIWIGRRLRIPPVPNYLLAATLATLYFALRENLILPLPRTFPTQARDAIPPILLLWSLCMVSTALLLFLRNRIPAFHSPRREFLRTSTAALCALPAAVLSAGVITRKNFHVREVDISFPNLPDGLHGLRLLQLSDVHLGCFFTPSDLARVVDASNALRPDLIVITGDLITTPRDPLDRCLFELRRLRAPSGVWGCMGNHELFSQVEAYTKWKAAQYDIRFLRYEAASLNFGNHRLNLVGVDYQPIGDPYLEGVERLVSLDSFNLLLSHNPDVFPVAAAKGFDLTLAGHTHGGQINIEILGAHLNPAEYFTAYTKGLYLQPTSAVYVNSGLGTIGMPVRIGAPPEITVIRLCRA